jgi:hypothetical protein
MEFFLWHIRCGRSSKVTGFQAAQLPSSQKPARQIGMTIPLNVLARADSNPMICNPKSKI